MTAKAKLQNLLEKRLSGRVLVESLKDGHAVVTVEFDLAEVSMTRIENEIARMTLKVVERPFNLRISNISSDAVAGVDSVPPPIEH